MKRVYSIGYEGMSVSELVGRLKKAKVDMVVDVRELPLSRMKGFSKNGLEHALAKAGIRYDHMPQLGSPRQVRERLRKEKDYDAFFREYKRHLKAQGFENERLFHLSRLFRTAVLCVESDDSICHRSVLLEGLARKGLRPVAL